MSNVPNTTIRTSHAVSLIVKGQAIGMIQSWQPTQSRTITAAYEIKSETSGRPQENVPGNMTNLTMQVTRYDLFKSKMEEVWGSREKINMLADQLNPFEIKEKWVNPDGTREAYLYEGCWFSQLGRPIQAEGNRIVLVSATLAYVRFTPLQ